MNSLLRGQKRWVLAALSFGALVTAIEGTIVTVALPSIRMNLDFSSSTLIWVVNAYMLTYAGLRVLSGRLGDVFGYRRIFLIGTMLFTVASLACSVATSQGLLLCARAVQGAGAASVAAVVTSLVLTLFSEPGERAKALGQCTFVSNGGASFASLLGGVLVGMLGWRWIFIINIPIGVAICVIALVVFPSDLDRQRSEPLDVIGGVTVTAAVTSVLYAIVSGGDATHTVAKTSEWLLVAAVLFVLFAAVETRATAPLIPFRLFRIRNFVAVIVGRVFANPAMSAWLVASTLYFQQVRKYDAWTIGLAFLPATQTIALFVLVFSQKAIARFGTKSVLVSGLLISAAGLVAMLLFDEKSSYAVAVLPGMLLVGIGAGMFGVPFLLASMNDVPQRDFGVAAGATSTIAMMGEALGLATIMTIADARTKTLLTAGEGSYVALNGGYHAALSVAAGFLVIAALFSVFALRIGEQSSVRNVAHGNAILAPELGDR